MSLLTSAVAVVVTDPAGRVLLCQQSQGHRLWGLPGGKIRNEESPIRAVIRDVREETGMEAEIIDLIGLYQLTGNGCGDGLPDVLMHVFRATANGTEAMVNSPGRICALAWHDPDALPYPTTATTRTAVADSVAGRSGVLRHVLRDQEPETPDATDSHVPVAGLPAQQGALVLH
jgi:ADP-ribose pyrophosphatase YjhB (NUDIX family)